MFTLYSYRHDGKTWGFEIQAASAEDAKARLAKMQGLEAGKHYKYNGQMSQIELFNGSVILLKDLYAYPSDPNFDELGSLEITDAFIDEANQIEDAPFYRLKDI